MAAAIFDSIGAASYFLLPSVTKSTKGLSATIFNEVSGRSIIRKRRPLENAAVCSEYFNSEIKMEIGIDVGPSATPETT